MIKAIVYLSSMKRCNALYSLSEKKKKKMIEYEYILYCAFLSIHATLLSPSIPPLLRVVAAVGMH